MSAKPKIDVDAELARIARERKERERRGQSSQHQRSALHAASRPGAVLDDVYNYIGRFVAYPSEHAQTAHSLWILHAHLMDAWESTPRIAFLSAEPASGKTRALEVTEPLVPNPVSAVNVSPAYLFRKVGSEEGVTILFDEIDTVFGPKAKENEELRGLLNAGHRRGAVAGRCVVRGKEIVTEEIPAYAAVALAGLGWLPDTILSRSVIVRMRRRHQGEKVEQFRRRIHAPEGEKIRDRVAAWAAAQQMDWPQLPPEIQDRDADVWEPLIAVADAIGGDWPKRARAAAVSLVAESKEREPSLGMRLLADLRAVFGTEDQMTSKAILHALHAMEEAPWKDIKGKPVDERGLAVRLRQYGVKSKQVRVGEVTLKGYRRAELADAWARYLSPSPAKCETSETSETSVENPIENVSAVSDAPPIVSDAAPSVSGDVSDTATQKPNENNDVSDVSDVSHLAAMGEVVQAALCDHCGRPGRPTEPLNPWDDDGREVLLHPRCEVPWQGGRRRAS
jgi:hypothetical protein